MEELNEGIRIVEANRSRGFFAGPRDPALITAAESALGGTFPPTYRAFLRHLGAGNFGAGLGVHEIGYGDGGENPDDRDDYE